MFLSGSICLFLLAEELGPNTSVHGGFSLSLTRPVVLGLSHSVSEVGSLQPASTLTSSALNVPVREVDELSSLGNVLGVVGVLLLVSTGTDGLILGLGETRWNVRFVGEISGLNVLLASGTVVITVGNRSPQVQVRDGLEKAIELSGLGSLGGRHEGRGGCHRGSDKKGGGLHGTITTADK